MFMSPGLLDDPNDPRAAMARLRAAQMGGGPDPIAITPQMQQTTMPPPMAMKPMAEVPPTPAAPAAGPAGMDRMAMSRAAASLGPGGGVQDVAQAAVPLLDMWQKKRQAAGKGSLLSGLLGK